MAHPVRSRLQVEFLEAREVPDGSPSETFDTLTPPNLPSGWDRWSSDASAVFTTATGTPIRGANMWVKETATGKVYSVVSDFLTQGTRRWVPFLFVGLTSPRLH